MKDLRNSPKEPGAKRIYTAGEKEHLAYLERIKTGIPLNKSLQDDIKEMQRALNLNGYNFQF